VLQGLIHARNARLLCRAEHDCVRSTRMQRGCVRDWKIHFVLDAAEQEKERALRRVEEAMEAKEAEVRKEVQDPMKMMERELAQVREAAAEALKLWLAREAEMEAAVEAREKAMVVATKATVAAREKEMSEAHMASLEAQASKLRDEDRAAAEAKACEVQATIDSLTATHTIEMNNVRETLEKQAAETLHLIESKDLERQAALALKESEMQAACDIAVQEKEQLINSLLKQCEEALQEARRLGTALEKSRDTEQVQLAELHRLNDLLESAEERASWAERAAEHLSIDMRLQQAQQGEKDVLLEEENVDGEWKEKKSKRDSELERVLSEQQSLCATPTRIRTGFGSGVARNLLPCQTPEKNANCVFLETKARPKKLDMVRSPVSLRVRLQLNPPLDHEISSITIHEGNLEQPKSPTVA